MVSFDPKMREYGLFSPQSVGGVQGAKPFGSLTTGTQRTEAYTPNYTQYDTELSPVVSGTGLDEKTSEIAKKNFGTNRLLA